MQGNIKKNAMNTNEFAKGLVISSSMNIEEREFSKPKITLSEMQKIVNGYVEFVYLPENKIMVVNEEGKINSLPINFIATEKYWSSIQEVIVGDVLIIDQKYID